MEAQMQLLMGGESSGTGFTVVGCMETGPPEVGLKSGNVKVLDVKCGWKREA